MTGSAPSFAHTYCEMYHSSGNNSLGLYELMGCEDRLMYLISETACLDALKDSLDDADIRRNIAIINMEMLSNLYESNISFPLRDDGSVDIVQLRRTITGVFFYAAQIYLSSLDPDFSPNQLRCVEMVEKITFVFELLPAGPNGFDRYLVWPYLISGSVCTASSDLRRLINKRIEQLGEAARFGSLSGLVTVLREVWRRIDASPNVPGNRINISWRHVMNDMKWDYLLI